MATAVIAQQARRAVAAIPGVRIFRQGRDLLVLLAVPGARDTAVRVEIVRGALVVRTQPAGGSCAGHAEGEPRFFRRLELPFTPRPQDVTAWIFKGTLLVRIALPQLHDWERHIQRSRRTAAVGRPAARAAAHPIRS